MTIPDVATQEYAKISLRALATASLLAPTLLRPLQHRGENVKFSELVPLNGRKPCLTFARPIMARQKQKKATRSAMVPQNRGILLY
jgi:hypothetical protein